MLLAICECESVIGKFCNVITWILTALGDIIHIICWGLSHPSLSRVHWEAGRDINPTSILVFGLAAESTLDRRFDWSGPAVCRFGYESLVESKSVTGLLALADLLYT